MFPTTPTGDYLTFAFRSPVGPAIPMGTSNVLVSDE